MYKISSRKLLPYAFVAFSSQASASAFQLLEQNVSSMGNAYAGSAAVAENAGTIFYNPAGLTMLGEREFSASLMLAKSSIKFTDQGSSSGVLTGSGNGGDAGGIDALPADYVSLRLSQDLYVGLGFGAPFGIKIVYQDQPWVGSAHSTLFDTKVVNVNPTVAYRVNEALSIGAGLDWQYFIMEFKRAAGVFGVAGVGLDTTEADLKLRSHAWGWNAGALLSLSPTTRFGLSYRSEVKHNQTGSLRFKGLLSGPIPCAATGLTCDQNVKATLTLPATWILSGVHDLSPRIQLLGDISWTGWSSIQYADIINDEPEGSGILAPSGYLVQRMVYKFRNTWRGAVGTTYRYRDDLNLKAGIAYDQTPVRSADLRRVDAPDNNRLWLTAGLQWKPSAGSALDLGIGKMFAAKSKIHNDQSDADLLIPGDKLLQRGVVNGTYEIGAWIFGANYSSTF